MSLVLVVEIVPKPGRIDSVIDVFTQLVPQVHREDGCERYALHRHGGTLVMIESWRDKAAFKAHLKGAAFEELGQALQSEIEGELNSQMLEPLPIGGAAGVVGRVAEVIEA